MSGTLTGVASAVASPAPVNTDNCTLSTGEQLQDLEELEAAFRARTARQSSTPVSDEAS